MVEDDRYCVDVLTHISAVQAALDKSPSACPMTMRATASSTAPKSSRATARTQSWPRALDARG